jgi:alkanesulfonate monooxygenase SsuD/methylene tetrahydromethanopterin reductase-like flavin-dependent oxidoreductase (luciferase family)
MRYGFYLPTRGPAATRDPGDALETFSILGLVAGATERLRLVTSVLVLP